MKIIILNGPPRSGKDTLANYLVKQPEFYPHNFKFSESLKYKVHRLYGIYGEADCFEDVKDQPCEVFRGYTPREMYIYYSEKVFKELHGKYYVANELAKSLTPVDSVAVISDGGFKEELEVLVKKYGAENVYLFRVKRKKINLGLGFLNSFAAYAYDFVNNSSAWYDFSNDSRTYIDPIELGLKVMPDLINSDSVTEFQQTSYQIIKEQLNV